MTYRTFLVFAALWAAGSIAAPTVARAGSYDDFALGSNAESQTCRGVWRFESAQAPSAVDLYCGAWDSPSGTLRVLRSGEEAAERLARDCGGTASVVADTGGITLSQVSCARPAGDTGPHKFGLVAVARGKAVYGDAYPSDWGPMVGAARVILGLDKPNAGATSQTAEAPGLKEIEAVYPQGAPGQGAEFNYELLRRRGFEENVAWSFEASQADFSELLRAHQKVAPDDQDGEAEILAEIGLNFSDAGRFQDAGDLFDRAKAEATAAGDDLLVTKIANYQAINELNQGHNTQALDQALAANVARDRMFSAAPTVPGAITAAQSRSLETHTPPDSTRSLLAFLDDMSPAEKAAILSAQASDIAAVAARALGRPDAKAYLDQALAELSQSSVQPAWLAGQIYEARSGLALDRGDAAGAEAEAAEGLRRVAELAPETRIQARMLLASERAKLLLGDRAGALAQGRQAISIFERQSEAPGMPAEVAATHIDALLTNYEQNKDPALAAEYFETLSLVWDGSASRAAAQLAARLGDVQGGTSIRAYQDAQAAYRTALARRVRIDTSEATPADLAAADKAAEDAGKALAQAESDVRARSPRYLELLNPRVATPDLIKALRPGEGYVSVVLTQQGGFGALVTKDGVTPYRIDLTLPAAATMVTAIRNSSVIKGRRLPDFDLTSARALYKGLFAPVEAQLAGLQTLHVDGGGVLASLPMGALLVSDPSQAQLEQIALDQDYSDVDWLARHYSLDTALGPAAFVRTRAEGGAAPIPSVVAFGDFVPDPVLAAQRIAATHGLSDRCEHQVEIALSALRALPQTGPEAKNAAAIFGASGEVSLGADFTDTNFLTRADVADASILVLATHGVLGLSSCFAEPALLTSVGPDGDGLIEASQLLNRALKARLVVLSACNTAGGAGTTLTSSGLADGGEALSGLARAFIYAGAPSVLATQWPIDATASALQTSILLKTASEQGHTLAQALGDAQRSLYSQAETAHPFFWSGFVLIGDGGAVLAGPPTPVASN